MRLSLWMRMAASAAAISLVAVATGAVVAEDEPDRALSYDNAAKRFVVASPGSMCDRFGEGAALTDEGDGCWYAPTQLSFLEELGFDGDSNGFSAADAEGDVLIFQESRPAVQQRYDVTGLQWAEIDATEALLEGAVTASGAVVGDAYDRTAGRRVAMFVALSEPPIWAGDTLALNTNTYADDEIANDMVRSMDPAFPNGGGDTNISAGWSYIDDENLRTPAIAVWSEAQKSILPGDIVAGPSEDPPGVWAIIGREHLGDRFNVVVLTKPLYAPTLIDRVEGTAGPFASFALDGRTQPYIEGFTMAGTADVPGNDFQLTFHTPYAPLFAEGRARIGFLMDAQEDVFEKDIETTADTIALELSLPTGATGITSIELLPSKRATVDVDDQAKPVALKKWLKGEQLAEINAAVQEIMSLSMSSRFELAEGEEVALGADPS